MAKGHTERAKLLWLRKRISLAEAPYLLIDRLGGVYDDALNLILEAVVDNTLPADVRYGMIPSGLMYLDRVPSDEIDILTATVATADLAAWLEPLANQVPPAAGLAPAEGIESQPFKQAAPAVQNNQSGDDWKDRVREIADELDSKDEKNGSWSSKEDMSGRVAVLAIERKIRGPHGQLTAGNILREALQGNRWKRRNKKD